MIEQIRKEVRTTLKTIASELHNREQRRFANCLYRPAKVIFTPVALPNGPVIHITRKEN